MKVPAGLRALQAPEQVRHNRSGFVEILQGAGGGVQVCESKDSHMNQSTYPKWMTNGVTPVAVAAAQVTAQAADFQPGRISGNFSGPVTNSQFLAAVLRTGETGWTTAFPESPLTASPFQWSGRATYAGDESVNGFDNLNAFYAVAAFKPGASSRTVPNVHRLAVLVADDMAPADISGPISYIIQTSEMKHQIGVFLSEDDPDCKDIALVKSVLQTLKDTKKVDANGNNPVRWARLPVGTNTKYTPAWQHRLIKWHPDHVVTLAQACTSFGVDLDGCRAKATSSATKAANDNDGTPCSDATLQEACSAINSLNPNLDHDTWFRAGKALSKTNRPEAFGIFDSWSSKATRTGEHGEPAYRGTRHTLSQWENFQKPYDGDEISLDQLFKLAREAGWTPDASSMFGPVAAGQAPAHPFVRLDDIESASIDAPAFTVAELIPAGEVTLLGAHGGVGKTALAQHLAVCLATGRIFLGKDTRKSKVLFYSAEDGAEQMRWNLKRECRRLGVSSSELDAGLKLVDASEGDPTLFHEIKTGGARIGSVTAEFERLKKLMESTGCDVLILDNASDTFAGDENSRAQVRGFIRALRTLVAGTGGAVLLLVHVDKATAKLGGSESYSGSTAWHNSVRSRLVLAAYSGVTDGLMLSQEKSNRGRKADPVVMQWVDGMPTFKGSYIETCASDSDVMHLMAELIEEHFERGESLSTSRTAHTNAHKSLSSDRRFPKVDKGRFWDLLREAERHCLIRREIYKTPQRKESERWRRAGAPSAPSAPS
jgi:hypothetical protein